MSAEAGEHLDRVLGVYVYEKVKRYGAVLLQGFDCNLNDFERFTQRIAQRFIHNGNDTREDLGDEGKTRAVTPGSNFIGPHSEYSYTPFRPDLLFFYCVNPAQEGGESLLWDGVQIWDALTEEQQRFFLSKNLENRYSDLPVEFIRQLVPHDENVELFAMLDNIPGFEYDLKGDVLDFCYQVPAQVFNSDKNITAFSNSIAVTPQIRFDDGSILDPSMKADLLDLMLKQAITVNTSENDILVVDNWRIMHGRTAFQDLKRKMAIRMGFVEDQSNTGFSAEIEEIEF